jgi:hypothetical protein
MVSTATINDRSIPDPSGACFYLDLPRELRDMIHEYALTYDDGLICTVLARDQSADPSNPKLSVFQGHNRPNDPNPSV